MYNDNDADADNPTIPYNFSESKANIRGNTKHSAMVWTIITILWDKNHEIYNRNAVVEAQANSTSMNVTN